MHTDAAPDIVMSKGHVVNVVKMLQVDTDIQESINLVFPGRIQQRIQVAIKGIQINTIKVTM
jgi:hypothetical protein